MSASPAAAAAAARQALPLSRRRQGAVGLALAALLVASWSVTQAYALWWRGWRAPEAWTAPLLVAFLCWLNVGLFIVAHDAMHGSLAPAHRRLNRAVGALCLRLYAGFSITSFEGRHFAHHRHPGTADDPDFDAGGHGAEAAADSGSSPTFWHWYLRFMREYFGWRQAAGIALIFGLLVGVLRAPLANVMAFWALPAALSSLQLFAFGTWLPHRRGADPFADEHRARSNEYGGLVSLLTCFHFGYHREHHLRPDAPWWRLPAVRRARRAEA